MLCAPVSGFEFPTNGDEEHLTAEEVKHRMTNVLTYAWEYTNIDTLFKQVLLKQEKEKQRRDVSPTGLHQAKRSKKTNRRRS